MPEEPQEAEDGEETDLRSPNSRAIECLLRRDRFGLLSDRRRRYVLRSLIETTDGVAEFDHLVDRVVELERAANDDPPEDHRQRVAIALHHVHLPRLIETGVVEYDWRNETVRYEGDDGIEACLAVLAERIDQ